MDELLLPTFQLLQKATHVDVDYVFSDKAYAMGELLLPTF